MKISTDRPLALQGLVRHLDELALAIAVDVGVDLERLDLGVDERHENLLG